jgi:septum formation protein
VDRLILASRSPRRRELLAQAGYAFEVMPAAETAECGICSRESPEQMVARLARQKAADVVGRLASGLVLGCDTVVECDGQILGKPADAPHAGRMLRLLRGREHRVLTGVCLWRKPGPGPLVRVAATRLRLDPLDDDQIQRYVASGEWEGKAGGFGYQDRLGWVHVLEGSESNVVGLPLELLAQMLAEFPGACRTPLAPREEKRHAERDEYGHG